MADRRSWPHPRRTAGPGRLDRAEILSRVSLADVLTREVGHPKVIRGGDTWWPSVDPSLPGTGKTPPTHIAGTDANGIEHFKDFASGLSGTAVDVVMIRRGLDFTAALQLLADGVTGSVAPPVVSPPRPASRPAGGPASAEFAAWIEACAERLWRPDHRDAAAARAWLAGRGYGEELLRAARVGYDIGARRDTRWPRERRAEHGIPNLAGVTIPMYGPDGQLTYAQTRNLRWTVDSPYPKYVNPTGLVTNPTVGYWRTAGERAGAPVIVVEGPTDALAARQAGYDVAALIGAGHAASLATAQRLVDAFGLDRPYLVMTDPDDAGRRAGEQLLTHLSAVGGTALHYQSHTGDDLAASAERAGDGFRHQLDALTAANLQAVTATSLGALHPERARLPCKTQWQEAEPACTI